MTPEELEEWVEAETEAEQEPLVEEEQLVTLDETTEEPSLLTKPRNGIRNEKNFRHS